MRFGRKKRVPADDDVQNTALPDAEEGESPDPSSWTLPADAAVTAPEQETVDIEAVAPATAAGRLERDEPTAEPEPEPEPAEPEPAEPEPAEPEPAEPEPAEPATTVSGASVTSPGLGADAAPRAAAAANATPSSPAAETATPPTLPPRDTSALDRPSGSGGALAAIFEHPVVKKRPEILVAGAFVGAFLAARILKRISE